MQDNRSGGNWPPVGNDVTVDLDDVTRLPRCDARRSCAEAGPISKRIVDPDHGFNDPLT